MAARGGWFKLYSDILDDPRVQGVGLASGMVYVNLLATLNRLRSEDGHAHLAHRTVLTLCHTSRSDVVARHLKTLVAAGLVTVELHTKSGRLGSDLEMISTSAEGLSGVTYDFHVPKWPERQEKRKLNRESVKNTKTKKKTKTLTTRDSTNLGRRKHSARGRSNGLLLADDDDMVTAWTAYKSTHPDHDSQAGCLAYFALAEYARRTDHEGTPEKLFTWLLTGDHFDRITGADEDLASRRIKKIAANRRTP